MTTKQIKKFKDGLAEVLVYFSSIIAAIVLISIFVFVFKRGFQRIDTHLLTNNYWSQNNIVNVETSTTQYIKPDDMDDAFSQKYGIALKNEGKDILITYVDQNSPFSNALIKTQGPNFGKPLENMTSQLFTSATLETTDGVKLVGSQQGNSPLEITQALDTAQGINQVFLQTKGGGIKGSLIATTWLIILSCILALPLGIFAAIYLTEYATDNTLTRLMKSSIEMLAGVPSIIFGLMGVSVLFPVTSLFEINSLSIILGSLTMAIMLLPIIIRQTQEALLVIPISLRQASLSLGATQSQTIFKVVLPSALPGLLSAILLSISRIIGESAALIYTMGTFVNDSPKLTEGATTLAVQIWSIMSSEQPDFGLASAISLIILILVLILNLSIKLITAYLNRKVK